MLQSTVATTIYSKVFFSRIKDINKIIIQSNTDLFFLRKNMVSMGYYIDDEELVLDKNIIYTVIVFKKGRKRYSYKELYLGPILLDKNSELFRKKCDKELKTITMILNNIGSGHYLYKLKLCNCEFHILNIFFIIFMRFYKIRKCF